MDAAEVPVALVTGASSGIGRATARAFARDGYATILSDLDNPAGWEAASECRQEGPPCDFIPCDVSDEKACQNLLAEVVSRFGRLDAAFNNAGALGELASTSDCTAENFDHVISVNLRGTFLCMREELRQMATQDSGGAIVNCSSVGGLVGLAGAAAYTASKHGVIGLSRTAALENARQNIRVNAICPGPVDTPMLERLISGMPGGREALLASQPVGRTGKPEEIALAVLWLCSSASTFVTGQAIPVDGGWTVC